MLSVFVFCAVAGMIAAAARTIEVRIVFIFLLVVVLFVVFYYISAGNAADTVAEWKPPSYPPWGEVRLQTVALSLKLTIRN